MELYEAHFRTMDDADARKLFIDFTKKVRQMRDKQKEYFRTRNGIVLRQSQALEREMDCLIQGLFSDADTGVLF